MNNFLLAERLKQVRKSKGLSQTELAELSGVSRNTIAKYESEKVRANQDFLDRMEAICKTLEMNLATFFELNKK